MNILSISMYKIVNVNKIRLMITINERYKNVKMVDLIKLFISYEVH